MLLKTYTNCFVQIVKSLKQPPLSSRSIKYTIIVTRDGEDCKGVS